MLSAGKMKPVFETAKVTSVTRMKRPMANTITVNKKCYRTTKNGNEGCYRTDAIIQQSSKKLDLHQK